MNRIRSSRVALGLFAGLFVGIFAGIPAFGMGVPMGGGGGVPMAPPPAPPPVFVPSPSVSVPSGVTQGAIDAATGGGGGPGALSLAAQAALGGTVSGVPGGDYMLTEAARQAQAIAEVQREEARTAALRPAQTAVNTANGNYGRADQAANDAKAELDRISQSGSDSLTISNLNPEDAIAFNNSPGATDAEKLRNLREARNTTYQNALDNRDAVYRNEVRPAEVRVEDIKNAR